MFLMLLLLCVRSSQLIVPEGLWGALFIRPEQFFPLHHS